MPGEIELFRSCIMPWVRRPGLALALARAAMEHRRVEREFRDRLTDACGTDAGLRFPHVALAHDQYLQRNFFSILFLSVFRAVGIPAQRRLAYGTILHAIRGIVTSADNILDDEDKGAVRLDSVGGRVLPNIVLTLLQQTIIHEVIEDLAPDARTRKHARSELMGALAAIAREEGAEERGRVTAVLAPDVLLEEVHAFRGGRLLELAFVVPETLEPGPGGRLLAARRGVHRVGLALQMLDDVTDLALDLRAGSHNVLASWLVHCGRDGEVAGPDLAAMADAALASPEVTFPHSTADVLSLAVGTAVAGFAELEAAGCKTDPESALRLLEMMFRLRGLGHLWQFHVDRHDGAHGYVTVEDARPANVTPPG